MGSVDLTLLWAVVKAALMPHRTELHHVSGNDPSSQLKPYFVNPKTLVMANSARIEVWDVTSAKLVKTIVNHKKYILDINVVGDNLVSAGED
jgi:hypothetical protein